MSLFMSPTVAPLRGSFRELDRLTNQLLSGTAMPASLPMDVWRNGDIFSIALDLPGIDEETLEVTLERGSLVVRAERARLFGEEDRVLMAERPQGEFTRQLMLGEGLDQDRIEAAYRDGVLHIRIPVAQTAQPRRVQVHRPGRTSMEQGEPRTGQRGTIETGAGTGNDPRSKVLVGNTMPSEGAEREQSRSG